MQITRAASGEETKTAAPDADRLAVLHQARRDVHRWSRYVEMLLSAFMRRADTPPSLASKLEAMRNKRDTAVTKVEALRCHTRRGWDNARRELDDARRELKDSWRTIMSTLERECLYE